MSEQHSVPRVLTDSTRLLRDVPTNPGAAWRLDVPQRDLDANIITLPPGESITSHVGASLDVLIHVLTGEGVLETDEDEVPLTPGVVVWVPRNSRRGFRAGPDGLAYFSVHQRKPGLSISARPV